MTRRERIIFALQSATSRIDCDCDLEKVLNTANLVFREQQRRKCEPPSDEPDKSILDAEEAKIIAFERLTRPSA